LPNDTVSLSYNAVVVSPVTSFVSAVPFVDGSILRAIINRIPDAIVARAAIMQNAKEK
jgi:hypothetical protein